MHRPGMLFWFLINLLPSHCTKKKQRCSAVDLMDLFVDFKPVGTSVEHYKKQPRKQRKQPYLLCLGTRDQPGQFFVVFDYVAIPGSDDVVLAVDRLFKRHYTLNLSYADEISLFYEFLQKCVYEITDPKEKISTKVAEIDTSIKVIVEKMNKKGDNEL